MPRWYLPLFVLAWLVMAGCAGSRAGNQDGESANNVSDRLFFGRNIPAGGQVSDSAFAAFLAEEVTPRFPNGLTIWRADGQWTGPDGHLVHEPVMVVEILHPEAAATDSVLEVVANSYRARFHQDAVMRVTGRVRMQLYEAAQQ